jgi:hypothetical protein
MRSPTFLPHCALGLLLAAAAYVAFPPTSFGGSYTVSTCSGPEIQARVGTRWRTFATVPSDRRGRLRYTHHFAASGAGES